MSYREVYESFRWNVPPDFNIAGYACKRWARQRERFALYWEDESGATSAWTYWDLQQAANRLSNTLAALMERIGKPQEAVLHFRRSAELAG